MMQGQLSQRGIANVTTIMPRIPKTILDAGNIPDEDSIIDLSVAENWMIRDQVLEIERAVVKDHLNAEVSISSPHTSKE